ncbi:MAG: Ferritin, partial [uncultured Solirubrobacteraceae bacterium]
GRPRLRRAAQRADRQRVRRSPAVHRVRGALRRRDAAAARPLLLPPGDGGARPRDDDGPVPHRRRRGRRHAGDRRAADALRRRRRAHRARPRAGEARVGADQRARRPRAPGGRLLERAVRAVVHQGADRGGRDDERPAPGGRALARRRHGHRGLRRARARRRGGRGPHRAAARRRM